MSCCISSCQSWSIEYSKLPEELRLQYLTLIAEQLYGFGPTLVHEKLTTTHEFNISVEILHWLVLQLLWLQV